MNTPALKTKAEQKLDWLQSLHRPLSDAESDELRKALHAVYCRNRRQSRLAQHRAEELALLGRVQAESLIPELGERV